MDGYRRLAVYHSPGGALGAFGAAWLGWDAAAGVAVPQPTVAGLDLAAATATARRYGFHATMKAPFRLAAGTAPEALRAALRDICAATRAPLLPALRLSRLGSFLALTPAGEVPALAALESRLVRTLDPFRAPPTEAELARRDPARLNPRQRALLAAWGYPHVLDAFRFHMTLTDALDPEALAAAEAALAPRLAALPLAPYPLATLSLVGEAADGRFRVIETLPLATGG